MSSFEVNHPLCHRACPTVGDLLRHADYDARPVIEAAVRLAGHRIRLQNQAEALRAEWSRTPWPVGYGQWELPPRVLLPEDLARGFLAAAPERVREVLFTNLECTSEAFDEAVACWQATLAQASSDVDSELQLHRPWARQFAWSLAHEPSLSTLQLLGHGTYMVFAEFPSMYNEGLITQGESEGHLLREVGEACAREGVSYQQVAPIIPRPYADRGHLAKFESMLAEGPGVMLVGEPGSGRRSLLRACQVRHRQGVGPTALQGFGFNIDRIYELPRLDGEVLCTPPELDDGCVFALVELGIAPICEQRKPSREWVMTLERGWEISGSGRAGRLVLGVTESQRSRLCQLIPQLRELPVLRLPRPSDFEVVVHWMCRVFELEHYVGGPVDLARILWRLGRCSAEDFRNFDHLRSLGEPAPRHFIRGLKRAQTEPQKPWRGRLSSVLRRLEVTPERLLELFELELALFAPLV